MTLLKMIQIDKRVIIQTQTSAYIRETTDDTNTIDTILIIHLAEGRKFVSRQTCMANMPVHILTHTMARIN